MKTGAELIAQERARQVSEELWSAEHDDEHDKGELAMAAARYIAYDFDVFVPRWPWNARWWKPKDRVSNLVRAGALIAAEIDRLQRKE